MAVTPPGANSDAGKLSPMAALLLGLVGLGLMVVGLVVWLAGPPTTVQRTNESTTTHTIGPRTKKQPRPEQRTKTVKIDKITTISSGTLDKGEKARPASAGPPSETVLIALLTAGVLLVVVAAMGRKLSNATLAGASFNFLPPEAAAALATQVAAHGEERPDAITEAAQILAWRIWLEGGPAAAAPDKPGPLQRLAPNWLGLEYSLRTGGREDAWTLGEGTTYDDLARQSLNVVRSRKPPA